MDLGAEHFIDFKEAGDGLINQIKDATQGGPHAAIVTAATSVRSASSTFKRATLTKSTIHRLFLSTKRFIISERAVRW